MNESHESQRARHEARANSATRFEDLLEPVIGDKLCTDLARFEIIRTRYTDQRQPIHPTARWIVYRRNHFRCVWCGTPDNLTIDHIIPWSAGGTDDIDNLRTLCWPCNEFRSNEYNPLDLSFRQLPFAIECVNCYPDELLGDSDLRPTFCIQCLRESSGIPYHGHNSPGWEENL